MIPKYGRAWLAFMAIVVCIHAVGASEPQTLEVPKLSDRVMDLAGVLTSAEIENLKARLQRLERDTTAQVAVLIIPELKGEEIEKYSLRVANTWKLGQKGRNNGVLLLFAMNNRKVRIEVGSGLERTLTDDICKGIIETEIVALFKQGKYYPGIEGAVSALDLRLRKQQR
jgi:uncharacterized protein